MLRRLLERIDTLGRFLARIVRTPFEELVLVVVCILFVLAICLPAVHLGGPVAFYVAGPVAMLLVWILGFAFIRGLAERRRERGDSEEPYDPYDEVPPYRLALDEVLFGVLIMALFGLVCFAAKYYPSVDPIDGEGWYDLVLVALAPGHVLVGLAGFRDRRICLAVTRNPKKHPVPLWARFVGWTTLLSGYALGGYIVFLLVA